MTVLLLQPERASAEWQLKPFLGATFGGATTFVDLEDASGSLKMVFGGSAVLLGEVLGIEGDIGFGPGFFQAGDRSPPSAASVVSSGVTTLSGNIIVALPRRLAQYTLRPYFVGGAGLMRVRIDDLGGVLRVASTLPAVDIGGGVVGFLTDRVGVGWDIRHFRSVGKPREGRGLSFGPEQLSFWRVNMSLAIRY